LATLLAPRPNPFSRETEVAFALREPGEVTVRVVDVLGREVAALLDEALRPAGAQAVTWDGRSGGSRVASGTYAIVLEANGVRETQAVTVVR
ncbi:MAG: FlgD immunoglobulin-like domain containing protein, partial [Bacteroidota bacterium]